MRKKTKVKEKVVKNIKPIENTVVEEVKTVEEKTEATVEAVSEKAVEKVAAVEVVSEEVVEVVSEEAVAAEVVSEAVAAETVVEEEVVAVEEVKVEDLVPSRAEEYLYIQYYGRECNLTHILDAVKHDYDEHNSEMLMNLKVYIKVEDNMAYYVANNSITGRVGMWNHRVTSADEAQMDAIDTNSVVFQYKGKEVNAGYIVERARDKFAKAFVNVKVDKFEIYVKIEDETAYILANDSIEDRISMF